jgi:hypothetical protein
LKPFLALRAAAKYFGLVDYEGDYISVSEDYINVLLEKSEEKKRAFFQQAVLLPTLYTKLFDSYGGKQLPDEHDLAVRLYIDKKYGITQDASIDAARVFIESVKYAGLLDENNYLVIPGQQPEGEQRVTPEGQITEEKTPPFKETLPSSLDHYEFTLETGDKVVLALPPKLSTKDKNRLKMLIDLIPDISDNKMTLTAEANDSK